MLEDKSISPFDLCKYDVVVTPYKFVQLEQSRLDKFKQQMQDYRDGTSDVVPKRPHVALLSGIWDMDGVKPLHWIGRRLGSN